ncbi:MAG TPA: TadE/TadG family type IV pilus assembly protein [Rhizomicrobium sp.]|nr:TadE/TadG family type IV pilus assembly protein [Rhizomicrobium sp.]
MLKALKIFSRARGGMAAAEFALILPVMLVLVFGAIEVTSALICKADVSQTASTASDLIAQEIDVSDADMTNVQNALTSLVYPFSTTNLHIVITSVVDDGNGGATVAWSDAYQATARTEGTPVTVPTGLITTGGSVIMAEVTYNYTTPSNYLINMPITMTDVFYSHPRRVPQITRTRG